MVDGEVGIRQNVLRPKELKKETPRPIFIVNLHLVFFILYLAASSPTWYNRRGLSHYHTHPMLTTKYFLVRYVGQRCPHKDIRF